MGVERRQRPVAERQHEGTAGSGACGGLHDRLREACDGMSYAAIGRATGANPETVRRYLNGGSPSAEFLGALCTSLEISADWLLFGRGVPRVSDGRRLTVEQASFSDLCAALARLLDRGSRSGPEAVSAHPWTFQPVMAGGMEDQAWAAAEAG